MRFLNGDEYIDKYLTQFYRYQSVSGLQELALNNVYTQAPSKYDSYPTLWYNQPFELKQHTGE